MRVPTGFPSGVEVTTVLPWGRRTTYSTVGSPADGAEAVASQSSTERRYALLRAVMVGVMVVGVGTLAICGVLYLMVKAAPAQGGAVGMRGAMEPSGVMTDARSPRKGMTCEVDPDFSKKTLKLVKEETMFALFGQESGSTPKYEASDVIAKDDYYYVICDSSWSIYRVRKDMPPFSQVGNTEVLHMHKGEHDMHKKKEDSAYEGIYYDEVSDVYYLVRESLPGIDAYHAVIEEVRLSGDGENSTAPLDPLVGTWTKHGTTAVHHHLLDACPTEDLFHGESKGLEGVMGLRDAEGTLHLLGLCEGNHCLQRNEGGMEKGNGIIVIMRKMRDEDGACRWVTVRHMRVPRSAFFTDYSAIAYNPKTNLVAITSQEDSRLWVGSFSHPGGHFDPLLSELQDGTLYDFPPDNECKTWYCNIEGIHWISDNMVVAVSDQSKKGGRQDFRCRTKDQSVHVFMVPL